MSPIHDRILVWRSAREATVVEPMDVYWLEAEGRTTRIRLRDRHRLHDHRSLGEIVEVLEPLGFLRIHRNQAVNLRRVAVVRRRRSGVDWEVKLEPPVNRVLPVARGREQALVAALSG